MVIREHQSSNSIRTEAGSIAKFAFGDRCLKSRRPETLINDQVAILPVTNMVILNEDSADVEFIFRSITATEDWLRNADQVVQ
jgi:hypothetical protein